MPYKNSHWQDWADTPLADREIPFLIFDLDGWTAEVTHLHADNYYQYARLVAPDGRVWPGVSSYLPDDSPERLPDRCRRPVCSIFPLLQP